jgi:glutathione synthase/RimK-type ligase-like ATP-grasp enzyme/antitoxin component of MazEF toxin-antitoxin module
MPPISIVPWKSISKNHAHVRISFYLLKQLRLNEGDELTISLGKKRVSIIVQAAEIDSYELTLPENLFKEFSLPVQCYKFHASYRKENNILYLGPVVGLLTEFNALATEPSFGSIHTFCEELHHGILEAGGFFYVFTYKEFNVQGYYYSNGNWIPSELPLPDVIYNRIHSRRLEYANDFTLFRKKLEQLNIPLFNDRFLSKWEVHQQLINENHLFTHVPETGLFSKENLTYFLEKYENVFIKPVHGSQGRSIFKLEKMDGVLSVNSSLKALSEKKLKKFTIDEIYLQLKPLLNNRIYIVQQGIPLITYESRGMDFRVLCHKNHKDFWEVTSVVARISAEEEFVSNIAKGGEVMAPLTAIEKSFTAQDASRILTEMKELAVEITSWISLQSSGIFGELGIDMGIDHNGKVWLIEVNSKPSKNFEDGKLKIRPSAKAIIKFCTKLAFDTTEE